MTTDDVYYERGINLRHGFLTEYYVDDPEYIVKILCELRDVGVLLEPTTVVEKGIAQAYEIQRRLRVWRPRKAAVMGYPRWLNRLLTHPVKGLENWQLLLDTLTTAEGAIKVYCEVAEV
jgi:hypothetical protein